MVKYPYDALMDSSKESLDRDRKLIEYSHQQTDSMLSWLIGISVTAVSLIVANFNSIKTSLKSSGKLIVLFLSLSIISGIAFRYVSYLVVIFHKRLEDFFSARFSEFQITPVDTDEDFESADFNSIIRDLKNDFNIDVPYSASLTESQQVEELPRLKRYYKEMCFYSSRQYNLAIGHLAEINAIAFKVKPEKFIAKMQKSLTGNVNIGFNIKKWYNAKGILFFISLSSFVMAVMVLCVYFLFFL